MVIICRPRSGWNVEEIFQIDEWIHDTVAVMILMTSAKSTKVKSKHLISFKVWSMVEIITVISGNGKRYEVDAIRGKLSE